MFQRQDDVFDMGIEQGDMGAADAAEDPMDVDYDMGEIEVSK